VTSSITAFEAAIGKISVYHKIIIENLKKRKDGNKHFFAWTSLLGHPVRVELTAYEGIGLMNDVIGTADIIYLI